MLQWGQLSPSSTADMLWVLRCLGVRMLPGYASICFGTDESIKPRRPPPTLDKQSSFAHNPASLSNSPL